MPAQPQQPSYAHLDGCLAGPVLTRARGGRSQSREHPASGENHIHHPQDIGGMDGGVVGVA